MSMRRPGLDVGHLLREDVGPLLREQGGGESLLAGLVVDLLCLLPLADDPSWIRRSPMVMTNSLMAAS